jgi:DNA-binding CsgD family transcriptional regulator
VDHPSIELVSSVYEAALDRGFWPAALERIRLYVGVTAIQLMAVDRRLGSICFSATAHVSEVAEPEYARRYCVIDPRVRVLPGDAPGNWRHCHEPPSDDPVAQDPFHQGLIIANGLRSVAVCKVYEDDDLSMVLGLHQGLHEPPVSRAQTARADQVAPHLERAARLSVANLLQASPASVGMEIVNRLRYPMFLLKAIGDVVHMNNAARGLLEEGDAVLRLDGPRLSSADPACARQLAAAFGDCESAPGDAAQARIVSLQRPGKRPLKGFVSPLQPAAVTGGFGARRLVMAAFAGPTRSALPDVSFLIAAYGLTPAEARVATQVALGKSIKQTAQELHVQPTTVRTQLDSVFRKTGTGKQSEMVAELLFLPNIGFGAGRAVPGPAHPVA